MNSSTLYYLFTSLLLFFFSCNTLEPLPAEPKTDVMYPVEVGKGKRIGPYIAVRDMPILTEEELIRLQDEELKIVPNFFFRYHSKFR